jgi:hypothetical protein
MPASRGLCALLWLLARARPLRAHGGVHALPAACHAGAATAAPLLYSGAMLEVHGRVALRASPLGADPRALPQHFAFAAPCARATWDLAVPTPFEAAAADAARDAWQGLNATHHPLTGPWPAPGPGAGEAACAREAAPEAAAREFDELTTALTAAVRGGTRALNDTAAAAAAASPADAAAAAVRLRVALAGASRTAAVRAAAAALAAPQADSCRPGAPVERDVCADRTTGVAYETVAVGTAELTAGPHAFVVACAACGQHAARSAYVPYRLRAYCTDAGPAAHGVARRLDVSRRRAAAIRDDAVPGSGRFRSAAARPEDDGDRDRRALANPRSWSALTENASASVALLLGALSAALLARAATAVTGLTAFATATQTLLRLAVAGVYAVLAAAAVGEASCATARGLRDDACDVWRATRALAALALAAGALLLVAEVAQAPAEPAAAAAEAADPARAQRSAEARLQRRIRAEREAEAEGLPLVGVRPLSAEDADFWAEHGSAACADRCGGGRVSTGACAAGVRACADCTGAVALCASGFLCCVCCARTWRNYALARRAHRAVCAVRWLPTAWLSTVASTPCSDASTWGAVLNAGCFAAAAALALHWPAAVALELPWREAAPQAALAAALALAAQGVFAPGAARAPRPWGVAAAAAAAHVAVLVLVCTQDSLVALAAVAVALPHTAPAPRAAVLQASRGAAAGGAKP